MDKLLDTYNLRARLSPAFIVLLPLLFALLAWVPKIQDLAKPLTGAGVAAGLLFILTYIARDAGERTQQRLIVKWGGALPSVLMLRHCDNSIDPVTKSRYHACLQKMVPKVHLPTDAEERADPQRALDQYEACCRYLRAKTREDKKFSLLKERNIEYGSRRNLHGLRMYGLLFSTIGTVACLSEICLNHTRAFDLSTCCLIGCAVMLYVWAAVINDDFVRSGAIAYAERLLESIDLLPVNSEGKDV